MQSKARYGARETNPISGPDYHHQRHANGQPRLVKWTEPGLKITRLRLLSDPGFPYWDVSYCHGYLRGEPVNVQLPFSQLTKTKLYSEIIDAARRDGVFAKRLGIFAAISTLN